MKRCSNKECCKQCRYVKFKGIMTKWPVQKPTHRTTQKHVEHLNATLRINYYLCFSDFSFILILYSYYACIRIVGSCLTLTTPYSHRVHILYNIFGTLSHKFTLN